MKTTLHKAGTRGHADHGWLNSYHTFSFANYYDPERVQFGALRVLNDDTVAPGKGFGLHPHDNMEIISIPLEGDLEHQDNMGNKKIIRQGDVQVMSAGTGIFHSEYNHNKDRKVKFLQIWIFPREKNVAPRYAQVTITALEKNNEFTRVVSPDPESQGAWIHQDAWMHIGSFSKSSATAYKIKKAGNGIYIFVLEGKISAGEQELDQRDGYGIWDTAGIELIARTDARVLLMEIPMQYQ
ncbi:MAG: pirin family protein [Bacteroidales bacterium]|nr:pirin family protein [Bacteroidales bacterium]MDT8431128.1 pirin family protein [Bacteroidales bacterium]